MGFTRYTTCDARCWGRIEKGSLWQSPTSRPRDPQNFSSPPSYQPWCAPLSSARVAVPEAHGKGGRPHATPPRSLQRHPSPICRPFCDSAAPPAPHLCLCARCRGAVETWRRRYGRFFRRMSRCGSCSRSQPLGHPGALQRARVPLPPCAFLWLRWFVVLPGLHPDGGGYGGG